MWLGVGVALALACFAGLWSWRQLRTPLPFGPWPAILACLAFPFALDGMWIVVRVAVSVFAVTTATKAWTAAHGGPRDAAMAANLGRFALWFLMPPESTWPHDATAVRRTRDRGLRRCGRGLAKLPGFGALYLVHMQLPTLHDSAFVEAFWALWLCWLGVSAIVDFVTSAFMLAGIDVEEIFDAPPLARSPRDFWGRRWNLFVHRFVTRFVFLPLGGRRHPALATLGVFACSGAMHEYFLLATLGSVPRHAGWMTAFFVLQGLAVVGEMLLRRRTKRARLPRIAAVVLHIAWLTLTGPLFFAPIGEIFVGW